MYGFVLLAAATIYPAIAILAWVRNRDHLPEPKDVVLKTAVLGGLTTIPILIVGTILSLVLGISFEEAQPTLRTALLGAFVIASLNEESFKFLVLRGYSARHDEFNEPFDGIVYGVAASLGFAIVENVMYVFSGWSEGGLTGGFIVAGLRALTAIPGHAACGVILGACIGIGRFTPGRGWMVLGFVAAVCFHGAYDAFLIAAEVPAMQDAGLAIPLVGGFVITFVLEVVVAGLAIARLRRDQIRWNEANDPTRIDAEDPWDVSGKAIGSADAWSDPGRVEPPAQDGIPTRSTSAGSGVPRWPVFALVVAGLSSMILVISFAIMLVVAMHAEETGQAPREGALVALGLGLLLAGGLGVVAIGSSIVALVRSSRWKPASVIALVASLAVSLFVGTLVLAGLATDSG